MGKIYQKIFANYYDAFMQDVEERLSPTRQEMLQNLKGNILEIGCGTGINFQYYNSQAKVVAIEPSLPMLTKAKHRQTDNISLYNIGIESNELDALTPQKGFDAVICTLVLCTVPDLEKTIDKIKSILSPQGKLIILEHIHAKKEPKATIQNIVNPVWKLVGEGCNLNRKTDLILEQKGFKPQDKSYFKLSFIDFFKGIYQVQ